MGERIVRTSTWEGFIKNAEGEIEYTRPLNSVTTEPDIEIDWVRQAPPVNIRPSRATRKPRKHITAVDLPDIQYGWRKLPDGSYVPLHDPKAMDTALQLTREVQPDHIILGGDDMDFAELSRFEADSTHFVDTTQMAIDGLHRFYAQLRCENPDAQIFALEGNHNRLKKYVLKNALALHGIRRAGVLDDYPLLSYAFLMRLQELEIEWIDGYPANRLRLGNTDYIHGQKVRSSGSTAELYTRDNPRNVVFHHIHRHESHSTTDVDGKEKTAISFGCLADTTGAVPSYNNGVTDKGDVVRQHQNWQNGIGIIEEYGEHTQFTPVRIRQGVAQLQGREFIGEEQW